MAFSQINVQIIRRSIILRRDNLSMSHFQQHKQKEPLTSAALFALLLFCFVACRYVDYLVLEELSDVPVVLVVPVVPVVPVVVFFFVEESPPTIPPSTRTGVNDVAIWSRSSF